MCRAWRVVAGVVVAVAADAVAGVVDLSSLIVGVHPSYHLHLPDCPRDSD
jgi:hypothetical protein